MHKISAKTAQELQMEFGERLRRLRIRQDFDQRQTAAKAGISERTLRALENGTGSTLHTLMLVLKALDALEGLELIAPVPSVSPMDILRGITVPRRVSRLRTSRSP
jgi:transcriptional regulator with XRE-family HTH domain